MKLVIILSIFVLLIGCEEPRDLHRETVAEILAECKKLGGDGIIRPEHIGKSGLTITFGKNYHWACARQEVSGIKTLAVYIMERTKAGYSYEVRK